MATMFFDGTYLFYIFCRSSSSDHPYQIILNSDENILKKFYSQDKSRILAAVFLMYQIRFSYFCRGSHSDCVCQNVFLIPTIDFREV